MLSQGNPFAFTGREDDGTGYYYYRARYYNPDQKRFISEDPLGFGGGDTNLQAYVGNNPVNATDPSGLRTYILPGAGGFGGGNIKSNIETYGGINNSHAVRSVSVIDTGIQQFIPQVSGAVAGEQIRYDLGAHPLAPGEPVNVIAYSNGNVALNEAIGSIRASGHLGPDNSLNAIALDPATSIDQFIGPLPKPSSCENFTILSNNNDNKDVNSPDYLNAKYTLPGTNGLRLPSGTSHTQIPDRNGWIQWLRTKGVRF